MNELKRFWKYAVKGEDPDECWQWAGCKSTKTRHATISAWGETMGAHRLSYRLFNGPIPTGLVVRHTCDNGPCTNPRHLILGTTWDNAQDREDRGRGVGKKCRAPSENLINLSEKDKQGIADHYCHNTSAFRLSTRYHLTVPEVMKIVKDIMQPEPIS